MGQIAVLKEHIAARKFQREQADIKVFNLAQEIRQMIGSRMTKNKDIPFSAIAGLAHEAGTLMKFLDELQMEILQAQQELEE